MNNENIIGLEKLANNFLKREDFIENLSALVMYHQICEFYIEDILSHYNSFLTKTLYPLVPTDLSTNKKCSENFFGTKLHLLDNLYIPPNKQDSINVFYNSCNKINEIRKQLVHSLKEYDSSKCNLNGNEILQTYKILKEKYLEIVSFYQL